MVTTWFIRCLGVSLNKKNKYVAVPFEEEFLPEYYIIDEKSMIEFAWNKRVDEILLPVKGNIDKKKHQMVEILAF